MPGWSGEAGVTLRKRLRRNQRRDAGKQKDPHAARHYTNSQEPPVIQRCRMAWHAAANASRDPYCNATRAAPASAVEVTCAQLECRSMPYPVQRDDERKPHRRAARQANTKKERQPSGPRPVGIDADYRTRECGLKPLRGAGLTSGGIIEDTRDELLRDLVEAFPDAILDQPKLPHDFRQSGSSQPVRRVASGSDSRQVGRGPVRCRAS